MLKTPRRGYGLGVPHTAGKCLEKRNGIEQHLRQENKKFDDKVREEAKAAVDAARKDKHIDASESIDPSSPKNSYVTETPISRVPEGTEIPATLTPGGPTTKKQGYPGYDNTTYRTTGTASQPGLGGRRRLAQHFPPFARLCHEIQEHLKSQ